MRTSLRLVGAGLPRTGTTSLKLALERLLGRPCYHMNELFAHPEHAPGWQDAFAGRPVDWPELLSGYVAIVDTPGCAFWRPLAAAFPDARVLLSRRADARTWYESMRPTVLAQARRARSEAPTVPPPLRGRTAAEQAGVADVLASVARFLRADQDQASLEAGYDAWVSDVRATVPSDRLVEWEPGDGWEPLCAGLGVDVPDEPFPRTNSTAEFRARMTTS